MADLSLGAQCVPSNAPRTSRRSVIGALALIPAIPLSGAAVAMDHARSGEDAMNMHTKISPAADRAAWNAALARFHDAQKESDEYDEAVYDPAYDEIERRAPRPSLTMTVRWDGGRSQEYDLLPNQLDETCQEEYYGEFALPVRAAWRKYEADLATAERDLNWQELDRRHHEILDATIEARNVVIETPAPDAQAFAAKLVLALDEELHHSDLIWTIYDEAIRLAGPSNII